MEKIFEMKQQRAKMVSDMREMMDRFADQEMGAENQATYDRMEKDFDALNAKIEREERQLARERASGETAPMDRERPKDEKSRLFAQALRGEPGAIAEYRDAMTLGTDATAGYLTAPVEFVNRLIAGLDDAVFMRRLATNVGPIGNAQSLGFPAVATDASDVSWTGEIEEAAEESTLTFARREFKNNRLAKCVKISRTLIRHAPNPEDMVLSRILYKIGIAQEAAYMTGDGSSKPLGIFTASAQGISTARDIATDNTATAVTFDGLMNAKYAVKGQYHKNASWVMHRDLVKMIAKLKDGDQQYVWQPSTQLGQPDMLLGAPVYMSEYAPNTFTTGKYVAVYGDFRQGYWVLDGDALEIQVLNELYARNNMTGYHVQYFGDGAPVLAEAFARVKLG